VVPGRQAQVRHAGRRVHQHQEPAPEPVARLVAHGWAIQPPATVPAAAKAAPSPEKIMAAAKELAELQKMFGPAARAADPAPPLSCVDRLCRFGSHLSLLRR